jgi:hypothetical protein
VKDVVLADIVPGIHDRCLATANEYVAGANTQVADAMLALGLI